MCTAVHPLADAPMEGAPTHRVLDAPLWQAAPDGASATQVADAACAGWAAIDHALRPVVGARGVAALYRRSVSLTAAQHRWLASLGDGLPDQIELAPLQQALCAQPAPDAAAGSLALLQTFRQVLASLIGESLTERLLQTVQADPSSGPAPQDSSQ